MKTLCTVRVFCDKDDPAGEWRKLSDMQQGKVDYLADKKLVVLKGPNIDLQLSIEGRTFINSDGKRNMPSGEIFTGPVEDSINGWVRFYLSLDCWAGGAVFWDRAQI